MTIKIMLQHVGRPNPTTQKHTMTGEFINKLQYQHRITSDNIRDPPNTPSLKFCVICVLGALLMLAVAAKI